MQRSTSISVIIPTWNRLGFLREAVGSVLAQSFRDWELIVVDDCSQDGTRDWLQTLGDERIRVLGMERHGERSAARNAGLAEARGEYVLFLDDDDWLLEGALACLFDGLRRQPTAIGAIGAYIYGNDSNSWIRAAHPRRRVLRAVWTDLLFGWVPVQGQSLLRRLAVVEVGGWNETMSLCEDSELWLRLARLGPVVMIPQTVLVYRIHAGQTARAGTWTLYMKMAESAMANRTGRERQKAERSILAYRLIRQAWRSFQRGHCLQALRWWWRAIVCAPWLLESSPTRALMTEVGMRCLTRAMLNDRVSSALRKAKRDCARAYHGDLRPPVLAAPPPKAIRGMDGRP